MILALIFGKTLNIAYMDKTLQALLSTKFSAVRAQLPRKRVIINVSGHLGSHREDLYYV